MVLEHRTASDQNNHRGVELAESSVPQEVARVSVRKEAKALGLKRYFTGKPCKWGHISERSTSDGQCFGCQERERRLKGEQPRNLSRSQAASLGWERYFNGKPCPKGHVCERQTTNGCCIECHRVSQLKQPNWSKANPHRSHIYKKAYYKKNIDHHRAGQAAHYLENKDEYRRKAKAWYLKNIDKAKAASRVHGGKRRCAEGSFSVNDIENLHARQRGRCATCKKRIGKKYHVDHIMPINLGGTNYPENLQLLCPFCNMSKHDKHPDEWARINGLLFI